MNYDKAALDWDTKMRVERAEAIAKEIGQHISNPCGNAMEFGCGTGLISFFLRDKLKNITLIDSSGGMIAQVTKKIHDASAEGSMTALKLDLTKDRYTGQKFDFIYSSMVFHHIDDVASITSVLRDCLRDGGRICIVDLDIVDEKFHENEIGFDGHHGFDQNKIRDIFRSAGFENVESKTFYRNIKVVNGVDVPYSLFYIAAEVG